MTDVVSTDPRTGAAVATVATETGPEGVDAACTAAAEAARPLADLDRLARANLLRALGRALEEDRAELVALADRESALGTARLNNELNRTVHQFNLFADAVQEGGYLEAVVDRPADTPAGPRPDLRRMLVPLGPVAVFGASNFPLAFSVPGGDTASALAAGCPVVVKAHPAHPATSVRAFEVLSNAARAAGAPEGTLSLVHGVDAGAALVRHPEIRAAAFTGSTRGGRALFDLASNRPDPIPFYGELGSLNPLVVTPGAARNRGAEIAQGLVGSFTLGGGQFCTKPGVVLVPGNSEGRALVDGMAELVTGAEAPVLLTEGVRDAYERDSGERREETVPGARLVAEGIAAKGGWAAPVRLLSVEAGELGPAAVEECFGPVTLVVFYDGPEQLGSVLRDLPPSLAASVFAEPDELDLRAELQSELAHRTGRIVHDGYPTGVAVTAAMQHGGPWPSTTNALHTSVGTTAIRRFLRPMAWQNAPQEVLPDELRDQPVNPVPRQENT
ncbi:aldehyde dehydrogenase (NADP(+)) [Nocardiopsis valliformis]|uniref:aldehyde dehydrogenase (NADP(+)) n=1 Tax=Nocardiopsis valliformis TaxID=239974 RepID=UPI00034B9C77|nr:aldehyde dehydrogenase (NADP(+)) [Nocardiopsis valliformis]